MPVLLFIPPAVGHSPAGWLPALDRMTVAKLKPLYLSPLSKTLAAILKSVRRGSEKMWLASLGHRDMSRRDGEGGT